MPYRFLPNSLTLTRIILIPALFICVQIPGVWGNVLAVIVFTLAGISDFLDGWFARRFNVHSEFGRMLDPIADMLLVVTALLLLVDQDTIYGVLLIAASIILCREILVSGLREYLTHADARLPVSLLAKYKTGFQMVAIGILLAAPPIYIVPLARELALSLLWFSVALTLMTGYSYVRVGVAHVNQNGKRK